VPTPPACFSSWRAIDHSTIYSTLWVVYKIAMYSVF
jgi:hypothetical protein